MTTPKPFRTFFKSCLQVTYANGRVYCPVQRFEVTDKPGCDENWFEDVVREITVDLDHYGIEYDTISRTGILCFYHKGTEKLLVKVEIINPPLESHEGNLREATARDKYYRRRVHLGT